MTHSQLEDRVIQLSGEVQQLREDFALLFKVVRHNADALNRIAFYMQKDTPFPGLREAVLPTMTTPRHREEVKT